jgi:hypothetical protein
MHHLSRVPSLSYHLGPIGGTWSIAEGTNMRRQPLVDMHKQQREQGCRRSGIATRQRRLCLRIAGELQLTKTFIKLC